MANEIKPINLSQKALSVFSFTNVKNLFLLYPTILREVESIIALLKTHKAHRFLDVDTKFLKYSKSIISPILSNICFRTVVFPNSLTH